MTFEVPLPTSVESSRVESSRVIQHRSLSRVESSRVMNKSNYIQQAQKLGPKPSNDDVLPTKLDDDLHPSTLVHEIVLIIFFDDSC